MALYPNQDTFVRGELSPRLHARASLDLYRAGLAKCENWITLPHGGLRKRAGTRFVDEVSDSPDIHKLVPFIFNDDQAYALVFGDLNMRVYAYGARVGTVHEVTPWSSANLAKLQFTQSADVMWLVRSAIERQTLTRNDHTDWEIAEVEYDDGPFEAVNTDEAKGMIVSAVTGTITIESDFDVFTAAYVGRLIRIDLESYSNIPPWEPDQIVVENPDNPVGVLRRYEGNVYSCTTTDQGTNFHKTGATPPTHLKGIEKDGAGVTETIGGLDYFFGMDWEYLHSGFGVARIATFVGAQEVTATVLARFPDEVMGAGNESYIWRFGAFGGGTEPVGVGFFEERLAYAMDRSVFASKTNNFDSFRLGAKDDDALQFLNAGAGLANNIVWIRDADGFLLIGTIGGIRALSGSGIDEALTPSSFKNRRSRTHGCAPIAPIESGQSFIYVAKSRKALIDLAINQSGRFQSEDLGQVSEHIPKKGIATIAAQLYPDPLIWFPLDNGELGSFTHQPAQEVRGMHRQRIAGVFGNENAWAFVEDCIVTPGQTGEDDVWLIAKRTLNAATKRFIEILTTPFEYGDVEDAFFIDSGLTYDGAAVTSVTGLSHLANQTVDVLADGRVYKGLTVSAAGGVSLPAGAAAAAKWQVGLPYTSEAETLELDVGGRDGSLSGRRKKVHKVILSLFETDLSGLQITSLLRTRWETAKLPTIVAPSGTVTLYTGNVEVPVDDSWEGQARIRIRHINPTPCTIRSITPVFDSEP